MTLHRMANACLLLGLALLVAAAGMYFTPADGPGAAIENPQRDPGPLTVGKTSHVVFQIDNPTRHVVRVVGLGIC